MNTDIDFMNIADGDKSFVEEFENFVNGRVSNPDKTGMAMKLPSKLCLPVFREA